MYVEEALSTNAIPKMVLALSILTKCFLFINPKPPEGLSPN